MVNGGHFQKGMTATSLNVGSRAAETRHLEFCYLFEQSRNLGRHWNFVFIFGVQYFAHNPLHKTFFGSICMCTHILKLKSWNIHALSKTSQFPKHLERLSSVHCSKGLMQWRKGDVDCWEWRRLSATLTSEQTAGLRGTYNISPVPQTSEHLQLLSRWWDSSASEVIRV